MPHYHFLRPNVRALKQLDRRVETPFNSPVSNGDKLETIPIDDPMVFDDVHGQPRILFTENDEIER